MKHFTSPDDIPNGCLVAPTAYFIPRLGKKPIGRFNSSRFFDRSDVSELLSADEWKTRDGRLRRERSRWPIGEPSIPPQSLPTGRRCSGWRDGR